MKQTLFMVALTCAGTFGVLFAGPFVAIAVYYLFAVLRPQYLWQWALPPLVPWSQYVAVAAIFGLVGYVLGVLPVQGRRRPPLARLTFSHYALLAFGLWIVLSYFGARNRQVAWPWLLEYAKIFTMLGVATVVVRTTRQLWVLYLMATVALVYIGWEVNALYLFQGYLGIYRNGYGGLDNNGAGLMLAMGVPLSLYAWEGIRRPYRWAFAAAVPVLLHAVMMTYSRGAMLSLLLASPVMLLRTKHRLQSFAVAVAIALLVPVLAGQEIRERFLTIKQYEADASANSRFGSWEAALRMSKDSPILGFGIRNANLYSLEYGADYEGRTIHSQYLQLLADSGYPALFAYVSALAGLAVGFRRLRRSVRSSGAGADERTILAMVSGVEGALLVFCIGALFLSLEVFELPYFLMFVGAQLAGVWSTSRCLGASGVAPAAQARELGKAPPNGGRAVATGGAVRL